MDGEELIRKMKANIEEYELLKTLEREMWVAEGLAIHCQKCGDYVEIVDSSMLCRRCETKIKSEKLRQKLSEFINHKDTICEVGDLTFSEISKLAFINKDEKLIFETIERGAVECEWYDKRGDKWVLRI